MAQRYRIYLDVCCLNRSFDDLSQDRIRLEAEAVLSIYSRCRTGEWGLVSSAALRTEIAKTRDVQRRERVVLALAIAEVNVDLDEAIVQRAGVMAQLGFKSFDAIHIASAEASGADVMLTTDDRLLRRALKYQDQLSVGIDNPVSWLLAVDRKMGEMNNDDAN